MSALLDYRVDHRRENALKLSRLDAHRHVLGQLPKRSNLSTEMLHSAFIVLDEQKDELNACPFLEALMREKCVEHD